MNVEGDTQSGSVVKESVESSLKVEMDRSGIVPYLCGIKENTKIWMSS